MEKPAKEYETGNAEIDKKIDSLIEAMGAGTIDDLAKEMITSSVKMGLESHDSYDLQLVNTALKEMRYGSKVFSAYRENRKVLIFGSARSKSSSPEYRMAKSFAAKMCKKGFMVVTGGGPGVMEAGNRGAPEGMDFALNIRLPFEQKPNPYVSVDNKLINFKYFFTRKLFFVKETDATAVFPGGFGTLDECFEVLTLVQTGKAKPRPIVLMEPQGSTFWKDCLKFIKKQLGDGGYISAEDANLYTVASTVDEGVKYIETFYSVYHSLRFDENWTIIRLNSEISDATLQMLNRRFKEIIVDGIIERTSPTEHEILNAEFLKLPRIRFNFNRKNYGRLYELIHLLNEK
ncbi:MAG TPA: TIGR00730 family Rossman fold protein [Chitinispirillaceae bacterium]|nr:TIGR00730 family Rossman fold protein [Chitinispirillaceae bacterium]